MIVRKHFICIRQKRLDISSSSVYHFCKSLYGLKVSNKPPMPSSRSFALLSSTQGSNRVTSIILSFFWTTSTGMLSFINDLIGIKWLQQNFQSHFHMKDMSPMTYFLGLEVTHSKHRILLTQSKYTPKKKKKVN